MKLCVIADVHGHLLPRPEDIPECDVLAIAGDLAPDISFAKSQFDHDLCRLEQLDWLGREYHAWENAVRAERILMTPGNHDWYQYLPKHCRTELYIDAGVSIKHIDFWFTPWIPPVADWNYMLPRGQRKERFAMIPYKVDVLISHAPAWGVLDIGWGGDHLGCRELRSAIYEKKPRHVFFGHIHEGKREGLDAVLGVSQMHHASIGQNNPPRVFDILPSYPAE